MSREIDERVVQMQFDNRDFESKVQSTLNSLGKLNQGLDMTDSAKGFENLGSAVSGLSLNPLIEGVQTVHNKFSALEIMAITALQNITNSAIEAGKKLVESLTIEPVKEGFDEYELKMGSVQTIMAGTGEDLDTVMGKLNELNTYADKTIYSFSDMTSNIGKFTNAGVNLEDSVNAIQGVANVAAISGANANEASRAMYNFAQALSAGYVKLIDWKSIENANMATVDFKTNLLEAAVAAGTVEKTADGMYKVLTTNNQGSTMDTVIDATRNFNDSLAYQWMTTEVLTDTLGEYATDIRDMTEAEVAAYEAKLRGKGYTEEQIEAIEQLGIKAANAATEVKTFTQLLDTLKEAVGSGWAETWEIVFGDFDEAKALWTGVSNAIGGVIDEQAKARNAILSGGLSSGWKQLMDEGVQSTSTFKEEVTQVAREHGIAVDDMIKANGSFEESLKEGWLSADIMAESLQNLVDTTAGCSREQLEEMGLTEDQAAAFAELNERVKEGSLNLEDYAAKMGQMSGRENIIEAFRNSWEALSSVISTVKGALSDVFPPMTADTIYNITERIREMSESFKNTAQTIAGMESFRNTFRGLFAVVDIVAQAISAVIGGVKQLISPMGQLGEGILGITGSFGEWLYNLDQTIKTEGIFKTAVQNVVDFLKGVPDKIREVFQSITGITISDAFDKIIEKFQSFREAIRNFFDGLKGDSDNAKSATDSVEKAFSPLGTLFDGLKRLFDGMVSVFKSLIPVFGGLATGVGEAMGTIGDNLGEMFANADFSKVLEVVQGGVLTTLGISLKGLIDNLKGLTAGKEGGEGGGLTSILNPLRETLETYQNNLKADTLIKIAGAIGILVGSVLILSTIDADALGQSVVALGALFGELVGAMALLNKGMSDTGSGKMAAMGITLDLVAGAVLILSSAMKKLAALNPEQIMQGLVSIGVLLGELVAFLKLADLDGIGVTQGLGLILLATSLNSMAKAVERVGAMDTGALTQGLIGLGVVLAELVAFLKFADLDGAGIGQGAGLLLIATSLNIIASAVDKIGSIDTGALVQGLIGMAAVLAEIGVFTTAMSASGAGNVAAVGAGLLIMSGAITVLAGALKILSTIGLAEMAIAVGGLGVALLELGLAVTAMQGSLAGAAALTVVALAVAVLAPALKLLATMSLADIGTSLLALAGAFTVIGVAGALLTPLAPALLALGASIALVGAGMLACAAAAELFAVALGTLAVTGGAGIGVFVAALAGLIGLIPELITAIAEGVVNAIAGLANSIPALIEGFVAIITALCEAVIECVPQLMEAVGVLLDATIDLLVEYLPKIVDGAVDIVIAILNGIAEKEGDIIDAAINLIISFIEGLAKGIEDNTERAIQAFESLGRAILNAFLAFFGIHSPSTVMADQGNNLVRGLINGVNDKISAAKEKIRELGQAMLDRFKQFKDDFTSAAQNVIGGLVSGVKDKISSAVSAAKDIGSSMLSGLKGVLGIASPSKEMAILGQYSTEGFANGLLDNTTMVARAADELGNTASENLTTAFESIGNGFDDSIFAEDPVIRPVLDLSDVNSGMGRLDSMLNTQRSVNLAYGASSDFAAMSQANQNASLGSAVTRLSQQVSGLESAVARLQRFADTSMGSSVGLAVKEALNGAGVAVNGRYIGEIVTDFQSGMERRGGF